MGGRRYGISLRMFNSISQRVSAANKRDIELKHSKRNSISPSNLVLFCLLLKRLTNKKKSTSFTFQKENALPFIHGTK